MLGLLTVMTATQKLLLLEGVHPVARDKLAARGYEVEALPQALEEEDLVKAVKGVHALGIRSKTQVTPRVLEAANELLVVGAFCIGTNQVALDVANRQGVPVFNAPYSNTRSVAELVLSEIIALSRRLTEVSGRAHKGEWVKSAAGAHEVRGRVVGIIGYGHIGSQLSVLGEALGLRIIYWDIIKKLPLGNAKACESLEQLLEQADFVTCHVPATVSTENMIGEEQLARMKKGACLINASRGSVVVIPALAAALKSGHIAGAAVDVFPHEPASTKEKFVSELQGLSNVILTPHIGGSTEEAQEAIGHEVADSLVRFLEQGSTLGAVNFPQIDAGITRGSHRILNVHRNVPGVLGKVNGIVSELGANIEGQQLVTDANIGYLIMDVAAADAKNVCARVSKLDTSIKTRLVY